MNRSEIMTGVTRTGDPSLRGNASSRMAALARAGIGALRRSWRLLARWSDRRRQRVHLDQLDDRLLGDIGVTRPEARREASRWFFD